MNSDNYSLLLRQAEQLLSSETDQIANAANLSALILHNVDNLNWAGFYFFKEEQLVLGPFAGQLACTRIPIGKGVCGTAYAQQKTLMVSNVHAFDGHIACDAASQSEIVVPFKTPSFSGVLDIDSPITGRFADQEKDFFEQLTKLYVNSVS